MILGIMQPYFMPYIGYFSLIKASDKWIVFDTPQFIRKGWVNRNRVLKNNGDWKYINLQVEKASQKTPINQILIKEDNDLVDKIFMFKAPKLKSSEDSVYWHSLWKNRDRQLKFDKPDDLDGDLLIQVVLDS